MTKRTSAVGGYDLGSALPQLAVRAADKVRARKTPMTWSKALASAPWDAETMPPAWERAFREAYANRLEERGLASPARPAGRSGESLTEEQRAERGIGSIKVRLPLTVLAKLDRDAKRIGCSRAKLIETLILR